MSILSGKTRLVIGNRMFVPTGKPVRIGGKPSRLGKIEEYGPSRKVTIVVGQNKGVLPQNQGGACARKPARFAPAAVDQAFAELRQAQVGRGHVAGTRVAGRGWYQGAPEASVAYEVSFVPPAGGGSPREPNFKTFARNMDALAETIAEKFCQDSVLIVRDDGSKRTVAGATWEKGKGRR